MDSSSHVATGNMSQCCAPVIRQVPLEWLQYLDSIRKDVKIVILASPTAGIANKEVAAVRRDRILTMQLHTHWLPVDFSLRVCFFATHSDSVTGVKEFKWLRRSPNDSMLQRSAITGPAHTDVEMCSQPSRLHVAIEIRTNHFHGAGAVVPQPAGQDLGGER